jgi:DNA-binding NtrC family response regulator
MALAVHRSDEMIACGRVISVTTRPFTEPAAGAPRLHVFWEGGSVSYPLERGQQVVIGRAPECEVRIDDASVSRRHAILDVRDEVRLIDLGSFNGTKVGGQRLEANTPYELKSGILVEIGAAMLMLQLDAKNVPASTRVGLFTDPMVPIDKLIEHVARSSISVILLGETGVGKEVTAEKIHRLSPRKERPLIKINCAALPESLLEAELFGYERGAFTGAQQAKMGLVEAADGGTLFLDEIGEMPLPTQAKLLRVVENREVMRLGALKPKSIDVRFVSATNRDLETISRTGQFREDLFYRLNGIAIQIPPLRDRPREIPRLADEFLTRACRDAARPKAALADDALRLLERHQWPGNVRELRNVIERAVVLCAGNEITSAQLAWLVDRPSRPAAAMGAQVPVPALPGLPGEVRIGSLKEGVADAERARILETLERYGGNQTKAAEALGISRRTLLRRLDEYALPRPRKS